MAHLSAVWPSRYSGERWPVYQFVSQFAVCQPFQPSGDRSGVPPGSKDFSQTHFTFPFHAIHAAVETAPTTSTKLTFVGSVHAGGLRAFCCRDFNRQARSSHLSISSPAICPVNEYPTNKRMCVSGDSFGYSFHHSLTKNPAHFNISSLAIFPSLTSSRKRLTVHATPSASGVMGN